MIENEQLRAIDERWEDIARGYIELKFDRAYADIQVLLTAVHERNKLNARLAEREASVRQRNTDMQAFMTELARIAQQKYAEWTESHWDDDTDE